MFAQLYLPHLEPKSAHNLFLALQPDWVAGGQALAIGEEARRRNGLRGKLFERSQLHVSLQNGGLFYDGVPREIVTRIMAAAEAVEAVPIELRFDLAGSYRPSGDKSPFALHAKTSQLSVIAFNRSLGEAMRRQGLRRVTRSLTPHMTLLYDRLALSSAAIEPIAWVAREFVLIHSHVGLGVHEVLGRWPLKSPGA